jgi:O-succinylbenzoate synthase
LKFAFYNYRLYFKEDYSALSSIREGALLRVTFNDGLIGHCDCHPWVELGDLPLEKQLEALTNPESTPLTPLLQCSLQMARLDAEARQLGCSLFEGLTIPLSHRLLTLKSELKEYLAEGFTHFKLKVGKSPELEIPKISSWLEESSHVRLRLDFNERLTRIQFLKYWDQIPAALRSRIDFVEDPYHFAPQEWSIDQTMLALSFAADHSSAQALQHPEAARVIIHKPAVETTPELANDSIKLVVTSYLDHPLGTMGAAFIAAKLKARYPLQMGYCGLLTHHCYQSDPFIDAVIARGPQLFPPEGTGFGFNTLLREIKWQNLK